MDDADETESQLPAGDPGPIKAQPVAKKSDSDTVRLSSGVVGEQSESESDSATDEQQQSQ